MSDQPPALIPANLQRLIDAADSPLPDQLPSPGNETEEVTQNVFDALDRGELGMVATFRPRLCQRSGIFFIAARQWWAPSKMQGLQMMSAAKKTLDPVTIELMARDLEIVVNRVYAAAGGAFVCSPLARASKGKDGQFAELLARALAVNMGTRFVAPFGGEASSPSVLAHRLPEGARLILVDELATSGGTIERHAAALQTAGFNVSSLVWVYGTAAARV